jgi:hypothetical protein
LGEKKLAEEVLLLYPQAAWPGKFDSLQVLGDDGFGGELDFQRECNEISKTRNCKAKLKNSMGMNASLGGSRH